MKSKNDDEIIEFAKLTFKVPLHIRFIEFMPIGSNVADSKDNFISNDTVKEYCEPLERLVKIENPYDYSVSSLKSNSVYRLKNAKGTISFFY